MQTDPTIDAASRAMTELYAQGGHRWDWWIGDTIPDIQPFALGIDVARIKRAGFLVMLYGARVLNALAFGYWV